MDGMIDRNWLLAGAAAVVAGWPRAPRPLPEPPPEYGWAVVEHHGDGGREVHVTPTHESDHAPDAGCWCAPKVSNPEGGCPLVVHNEKN